MGEISVIFIMLFYAIISLLIYFIPTLVAIGVNHINKLSIFILNLFLGWSLLGWVIALIWAFYKPLRGRDL